jgi:hypothetical protein
MSSAVLREREKLGRVLALGFDHIFAQRVTRPQSLVVHPSFHRWKVICHLLIFRGVNSKDANPAHQVTTTISS